MGENPVNVVPEFGSLNMDTIRSRLKDLSTSVDDIRSSSEDSISQLQMLLDDFNHNLLVLNEDPDVDALSQDALESYIEQVNKELHSTEEENVKLSREIDTLKTRVSTDSAKLDGDLEALSTLLNLIDSKGMFSNQNSMHAERSFSGGVLGSQMQDSEVYKFKVLELSQEMERNRSKLTTLEDLNHSLKRLDTICSFGDLFCGVKCIQYEDNCIKLSLRTPISSMDFLSIKSKLDCSLELTHLDHELFIELTEKMELKNVERKKRANPKIIEQEKAATAAKDPVFSCPICMNPLADACSTICGHVFCQACIKQALQAQKKCPTCRRKLTMNNFHRVFLPITS